MPEVFRAPTAPSSTTNTAYFGFESDSKLLDNDGRIFPILCGRKSRRLSDVADGTASVLLVVEAQVDCPWTKPAELPFDPMQPLPKIGGIHAGGFCAAGADCRTYWIPDTFDAGSLLLALQLGDGHSAKLPPPTGH